MVRILGIELSNVTMEEAIESIRTLIYAKKRDFIVTPNVDHIVRLQHDNVSKEIYSHAHLVLADGMPLIWASKFLGTPLKEKVSGSDLFLKLCEVAAKDNFKVFLLGGRGNAAKIASENLSKQFKGLNIVGHYGPPFGFEDDNKENERVISEINSAKPNILFVGLGSPKQEKWIWHNLHKLEISVAIGVGVSIEFASGMIKRAPLWMQKTGLEWFWRLMMEPKRLGFRYLRDFRFFLLLFNQKCQLVFNS
jgi:N-acetylglucosaminyldiphosphoundecaprenol N-acetyl-beta-D-mannosaminyltransferase